MRTSRTWLCSPAAEAIPAEPTTLAAAANDATRVNLPSGVPCRISAACTNDLAQRIEAPRVPWRSYRRDRVGNGRTMDSKGTSLWRMAAPGRSLRRSRRGGESARREPVGLFVGLGMERYDA